MTAVELATAAVTLAALVTPCVAAVVGLVVAGKWIMRRADVHEFAEAIVPQSADVAATDAGLPQMRDVVAEAEATVYEAECLVLLDEAIEYVEAALR